MIMNRTILMALYKNTHRALYKRGLFKHTFFHKYIEIKTLNIGRRMYLFDQPLSWTNSKCRKE